MFKKIRTKGSVFIEYLVVFPIFIIMIWLIMELMMYVYANNQVDHAADEGAKYIAQQMRGYDGTFDTYGTADQRTEIGEELYARIKQSLANNGFVLFDEDEDGNQKSKSEFLPVVTDEAECDNLLQENTDQNVMCILTETITNNGRNQNEIVVRLKMPFKIIGNFIPAAQGKILLYGNGVSTVDVAGRYQYY